jgi:hypothetical protein
MATISKIAYSRVLRTVGQALEKRRIDLFDLRCHQDKYFLQCGDPTPPHLSLVELRYTLADLHDLDLDARDNRAGSFKLVNFEGLPEILRALGRRVEEMNAQLLRICNSESFSPYGLIQLQYQTRAGEQHVEELRTAGVGDYAMRMYKERTRISGQHANK